MPSGQKPNRGDDCDAYFALPANADYRARGLQKTRPFLDLSYALVAPASRQFAGLADLKGLRIGVLHGTPPHILLARHEGYATSSFKEQGEAFDALARGEIDGALLWGPSAGYENMKRFGKRWRVTPVRGEGLGGQVAVAVRSDHQPLLAAIDKALADLAPEIAALADKYGFPRGNPVELAQLAPRKESTRMAQAVAVPGSLVVRVTETAVDTKAGQVRFNNTCSHCHGKDGYSPIAERDLRRLHARYKDAWKDTALQTISNGRPDAGMPAWKDVLTREEIEAVLGFLATIQK